MRKLIVVVFLIGFCQTVTNAEEKWEQLKSEEIKVCLRTYDRFSEIYSTLLVEKSQLDQEKGEFLVVLEKVQKLIDQAQLEACNEQGISLAQYHKILRRLFAVQKYIQISEVKEMLIAEIQKLESMTDENIYNNAMRSNQETEEWFAKFYDELKLAKKNRDEHKQQYLERVRKENEEIKEYNRNLKPSPKLKHIQDAIAQEKAKLQDPKYASMRDGIKHNIEKMTEIKSKIERKERQHNKKEKDPDPRVMVSFNKPVESIEAKIASYEEIVMQPMRDQQSSDEWKSSIQTTYDKKLQTKKESLRKLEIYMSQSRLKQAHLDLPIVEQIADRKKIMSLMPSSPDDRPKPVLKTK